MALGYTRRLDHLFRKKSFVEFVRRSAAKFERIALLCRERLKALHKKLYEEEVKFWQVQRQLASVLNARTDKLFDLVQAIYDENRINGEMYVSPDNLAAADILVIALTDHIAALDHQIQTMQQQLASIDKKVEVLRQKIRTLTSFYSLRADGDSERCILPRRCAVVLKHWSVINRSHRLLGPAKIDGEWIELLCTRNAYEVGKLQTETQAGRKEWKDENARIAAYIESVESAFDVELANMSAQFDAVSDESQESIKVVAGVKVVSDNRVETEGANSDPGYRIAQILESNTTRIIEAIKNANSAKENSDLLGDSSRAVGALKSVERAKVDSKVEKRIQNLVGLMNDVDEGREVSVAKKRLRSTKADYPDKFNAALHEYERHTGKKFRGLDS